MNNCKLLIFLIILLLNPVLFSQSYKVTDTIKIGGEGRWDYLSVDTSTQRLYVSHQSKVHVIDLSNYKIIGEVTGLSGVHGIAFSPEADKGFITNGTTNSVTVFNLRTLKTVASIPIHGDRPDAIIYDPFTKQIFVFNASSNSIAVINPFSNEITGEIKLEGNPEYAASDNKGRMFVNIENASLVVEFDPKSLQIKNKWSLSPLESPTGMAMDIKNNVLFVVGANQTMAVMDANTGKIITTLPIGKRVDGCAFDPQKNLAFSSNGEGTVTVVKENSPHEFDVIETVHTEKGARTITLDPLTHKLYTITQIEKPGSTYFGVLVIESKK